MTKAKPFRQAQGPGSEPVELIEKILQETFQPVSLTVIDDSAKHAGHAGAKEGGHYHVSIVSAAFMDKKLIDRHRMIYEALKPLKSSIHALAISAQAPPILHEKS
jgi:BolA protein